MTQWEFAFDSASLRRIERLAGFEAFLAPEMLSGMRFAVDLLQTEAQAFMWAVFTNPQGPLEDAVQTTVHSPYLAEVYNDLPYAWRREVGFSGMTDALGRTYPHDPGIQYFENALAIDTPAIKADFEAHVAIALAMMGR